MYVSRSIYELLAEWKRSHFTGMALVHVRGGVPRVVEFGRPNRVELQLEEPLVRTSLAPAVVPISTPTIPCTEEGLTTQAK